MQGKFLDKKHYFDVNKDAVEWMETEAAVRIPDGIHALYLEFTGEGAPDMVSFSLCI